MVDPAVYPYYERLNQNPEDAESLLFLWQWHGDRGEFQALATLAEQVASRRQDPTSAADLFFRAGELWAKNVGRHDKAVGNYRRAYELDPSQTTAMEAARSIYLQLGNHKLAVQLFERQLSTTGDPAARLPLLRDFAALRGQLGDPSGQAAALEEVIRISPDDYEAMRELAAAYLARAEAPDGGDADRMRAASLLATIAGGLGGEHAVAFAEAALDAWPGDEQAFQMVRDAYMAGGRGDELAMRQIHFVTANPESPLAGQVRRELAELYISAGQIEDAISALEPIAASDPGVTEILVDLYRRAGRSGDLLALLRTLPPSTDPTQRVAELREIAELCGQHGDRAGMVTAMASVLAFDPGDAEALALVEDDLRNRRAFGELRQILFAAARADGVPTDVRIARLREVANVSEEHLGDANGAVDAWRSILALVPGDADALATLEQLFTRTQRWDDLVALYAARAADAGETDRRAVLEKMVAVQRDRRNDPAGEAGALAAIWSLEPDDDAVAVLLVDARRRAGDLAGVTEVLRARADRAGGAEAIARHTELADHLESSGDRDAALGAWQEVATLDPALPKPWESIERILERTARLDLLIDTLVAHASGPAAGERSAPLHARAADIARSLGDLRTAREQAQIALEKAPDDEAIATLLMDVLEALGERDALVTQLRDRAGRTPDGDVKIALLRRAAHTLGKTDPLAAGAIWNELRDVAQRTNKGDDGEALEALAGLAELAGDTERLQELLGESARFTSDPAARMPILARRADILANELQRTDDAIAALRQIVDDIDPGHEPTWARIGSLAAATGNHALAAESLEKRIGLTEDDEARAAIASRLADLCEKDLSDIPRALAALEAWYDADPTDYTVVTRLATLYERESRWPEVIKYLEVLAEVEGDDDELSAMVLRIANIAEDKAGNAAKAFDVLKPVALAGDSAVLDAMRELSERHGFAARLVAVLTELASKAKSPGVRAGYWREIAGRSERNLNDATAALEAWLKALGASPADRESLDAIDRLAIQERNAEAVTRAYALAIPSTTVASEIRDLAVRGAGVLETIGAHDAALDLAMAAQNRAMGEDALLDVIVRLAPVTDRGSEMFVAFDRRRKVATDDAERFGLVLRAAESALVALGDRSTTFDYLKLATRAAVAGKNPDETRLERIEDLARRVDADHPELNFRTGVVELFAQLAEDDADDSPRIAALLQRHAGRLCLEDLALPDHAWQLFTRAVSLWPNDVASAEWLERVAERLGRGSEVVDLYQRTIDDAYDAQTARFYQARRATLLADVLGRVDDAIEALRHLVEIAPKDVESIRAWQALLRRHGRHQDLLMALERELQAGAGDALAIRKEIATVWEKSLRNQFEAKDAWKKVQKLAPNDSDALAALERLEKRRSVVDPEDDFDSVTSQRDDHAVAEIAEELSASAIQAPAADEISSSEIDAPPPEEISSSAIGSPDAEELSSGAIQAPAADDDLDAVAARESESEFSGQLAAHESASSLGVAPPGHDGLTPALPPSGETASFLQAFAPRRAESSADAASEGDNGDDDDRATGDHRQAPAAPRVVTTAPFGSFREHTSELTNPDLPTVEFSTPMISAVRASLATDEALAAPPDDFVDGLTNPNGRRPIPQFSAEETADSQPLASTGDVADASLFSDAEPASVPYSDGESSDGADYASAEPMEGELDAEPLDAEPLDAEPMDAEPLDAEPFDDVEPLDDDEEIVDADVEDASDDLDALSQMVVAPRASSPPRQSMPPPPPPSPSRPPSGRKH